MRNREYQEIPNEPDFSKEIMSAEEYGKLEDHGRPYRYDLKAGDKEIIFLGFGHSSDPENPAFQVLKNDIEKFHPDLVMVEGFNRINNMDEKELQELASYYSTEEDYIKSHGENTYAAKLAIDRGVKVISPEPDDKDMVEHALARGSSKEAIFAEQIATLLHQYHRIQIKPSVEEYLENYLKRMQQDWGWEGFDFSYENFKHLYPQLLGKDFNLNDTEEFKNLSSPIPRDDEEFTVINQAAQFTNEFRDQYIVNQIQQALKDHKKIYIIYGATHAVMQEPALRKMMEYEAAK